MTQPDGWQPPYEPPASNGPDQPSPEQPSPPAPPEPYQSHQSSPYQQQPYQPQPYQQQPAQQQPAQQQPAQPSPYQPQPGAQPGQPPAYGYPPQTGPYGYGAPLPKNPLGVWSLVLGIVGVVLMCSCGAGFLTAIPAVITGHLSRKAQREGQADNGNLGLVGLIIGYVVVGLTVLGLIGFGAMFSIPEFREGFFSEMNSSGY